ncbi:MULTISPECIES: hypothetical protein [unclassified Bradyrhizobium]|uniref:hypothetical protein n=1 Tax=unclassified Bradyrhizobium TaxID=2631580 RepID=UPI003392D9B0
MVKQRLKLGAISPKLMQAYRDEELTLEEPTAFAITDDHARQEQVWNELPPYNRSRDAILQALSEGQVSSDDRRASFVGAAAYEAAGGAIIRDLFDEEGGGFFADAALLNRLVREKLAAEAATIKAEGWKWIVVEPEFNHEMTSDTRRVFAEAAPLSDTDQAKLVELEQRHNALSDEDDGSEEFAEKLQALEAEIEALTGAEQFDPGDIAIAGAFFLPRLSRRTAHRARLRPRRGLEGGFGRQKRRAG